MEVDITPILEAIISLVAVIFTVLVIPYIKSKTTIEQQAEIYAWVQIAVSAAEQLFKGIGRGEEKKQYVLDWLAARNIKVNADELDAMIESAVFDLNKEKSENDEKNC